MSGKKIRVVVAKPGLDGHDRGAKVIARALRDAGLEVVYTGIRQTPEQIVAAVLQEDAQVLCLSILSGAHNHLFPQIMDRVRSEGLDDLVVLGGGIIPEEDVAGLKEAGIQEVFGPGTPTGDIVQFIESVVPER